MRYPPPVLRDAAAVGLARAVGSALAVTVSAPADLWAERLPIHAYNTSDGLAHDRIRCIVPDSRGFLWFCTVDGLSRFDGSRFVNYGREQGLPHPSVEEIVEVGQGVYWVATAGGLARLRSDSTRAREVEAVAPSAANARVHDAAALPLTATRWALTRHPMMC